jgi:hypothetical protein
MKASEWAGYVTHLSLGWLSGDKPLPMLPSGEEAWLLQGEEAPGSRPIAMGLSTLTDDYTVVT